MNQFKEHEIEWNDEKVGRLWNYYSKTPPYKGNYFSQTNGANVINIFKKNNDLKNPVILDFGGGKGFMFEHTKKYFNNFKYYNSDFSKDSVEASILRLNNNIEFMGAIHIDRLPLELDNNSVDIIYLIEVIEHLNDQYLESTLKEISRLLKTNGKLVLTAPNNEDLSKSKNFCPECGSIYHKWQHVRTINKENLMILLNQYGFGNIEFYERNFNKPNSILINFLVSLKQLFKKPKYENLICFATKK